MSESKPEEDKWVRSASRTSLGKLQKRISRQVLAIHDKELPVFIYGGVGEKGVKDAVAALLGKKNKRILLKIDMRRFFEHVLYDDIVGVLTSRCGCGEEVARIIAEIACVQEGKKSLKNKNKKVLARGFSTSSRLAVWCNLDLFEKIFQLMSKRLRGHDPRIAVYMDDIGITASRVDPVVMALLYDEILNFVKSGTKLEINESKTRIVDYFQREYNVADGSVKEGVATQFEFLGIGMGRSSLYPGVKIRSKIAKGKNKPNLSEKELRSLKGRKRYVRYVMRKDKN